MIKLLATVDAITLKDVKNRIVRIRGEPVDRPPKKGKTIETRARRWMMSDEWMKEPGNEQWDVESRIAASGKAWGDEEDPEDVAKRIDMVKLEKKSLADKRKKRQLEAGQDRLEGIKKTKRGKKTAKNTRGTSTSQAGDVRGPSTSIDQDELEYD